MKMKVVKFMRLYQVRTKNLGENIYVKKTNFHTY